MKHKSDTKNDNEYFTNDELATEFGYKNASSFRTSRANKDMMRGISFVVKRVETKLKKIKSI